MDISSIWKVPIRIFGYTFFALLSFIVLLFLFSLFFVGAGLGVGSMMANRDISDFAISPEEPKYGYISGKETSDNLLLAVPVEGIILGTPSWDMGPAFDWEGVAYGYEIQEILKKAAADDAVKGIFLHMQTPGGTIYGSMAIYNGIRAYQQATRKPVLVYIEGLSASGGVMSMAGADAIYADHGSLIGSIGVIGAYLRYYDKPMATEGGLFGGGIVTQGGIEHTVITSGKSKDLGNPFRKATDEEIRNIQEGTDNAYMKFVHHMTENRKIEAAVIREQMGAQIFDNDRAQAYGLIDGTLSRTEALNRLAEMAKVGEDFQLVKPKKDRKKFWEEFFWSTARSTGMDARRHKAVQRDICQAATHIPLVYYGNPETLCRHCEEARQAF